MKFKFNLVCMNLFTKSGNPAPQPAGTARSVATRLINNPKSAGQTGRPVLKAE